MNFSTNNDKELVIINIKTIFKIISCKKTLYLKKNMRFFKYINSLKLSKIYSLEKYNKKSQCTYN